MIEKLREFLQAYLVSLGFTPYYFRAARDAPTPYAVYSLELRSSLDDDGRLKDVYFTIDVFGENDIELDAALDKLDVELRRLDVVYKAGCIGAPIYPDERSPLGWFGGLGVTVTEELSRNDVEEDYPLRHKEASYDLHIYF